MIWLVLAPMAAASAQRSLPRVDEALQTRRYWAVEVDASGTARPRWRNRRGKHQCWTWPDGVAEHCHTYDGRKVVEHVYYDASGRRVITATLEDGAPTEVTVHGLVPAVVPVGDWVEHPVGPLQLLAPTADGDRWSVADGELRTATTPAGDESVFDDRFRAELQAWCACVVEDRTSAWIDGVAGVRYRIRHPHPSSPSVGEVWAVPKGDQVVLIGFVVPGGPGLSEVERRLAGGRATVALARWAQEDP